MGLGLVLAGATAIGNLFGGRKRYKAQQRADADYQARLAAATGYDLDALRRQADASGFNPLTILQATGGQGYDYRGGVAGPGQAAQYAGYVGDAIASGAESLTQALQFDRQMSMEQQRIDVSKAALASMPVQPFGGPVVRTSGGGPMTQSPFSSPDDEALWRGFDLPEQWWNPAPVVAPAMRQLYTVFSRPGVSTVVPEGTDFESTASGIFWDGVNKAKQQRVLTPDAERIWWNSATDTVVTGIGGAKVFTNWAQRWVNPWRQ